MRDSKGSSHASSNPEQFKGTGLSTSQHNQPANPFPVPARPPQRPLKFTLCITQRCNLACAYCYIAKTGATMTREMAHKTVDFIFRYAPPSQAIEIGFFGGEPLLEFELIREITDLIETHPGAAHRPLGLTLTTNGTVFNDEIADFLSRHRFKVCVSCDGPPQVHDVFRRTRDGQSCSAAVERTLRASLHALPEVVVNAVFHPRTFRHLPETVEYFSALGLRQIYLNPDFSAAWTATDAADLSAVYEALGQRYCDWYLRHEPHFVSLIDAKIAVLLRGGYHPLERCQMGKGEMAFTADGGIYPCERLIADGTSGAHRIGHIERGLDLSRVACRRAPGADHNPECLRCGLKPYCMNWCGCSNVFMTGYYNRVGPFLCAAEKAAIQTAWNIFASLEKQLGPVFLHHLSGNSHLNSLRPGQSAPNTPSAAAPPSLSGQKRPLVRNQNKRKGVK